MTNFQNMTYVYCRNIFVRNKHIKQNTNTQQCWTVFHRKEIP